MTQIEEMDRQAKEVTDAIALFPETFSLRAFPKETFTISKGQSYYADDGPILYVYIIQPNGKHAAFAKGTPEELMRELR